MFNLNYLINYQYYKPNGQIKLKNLGMHSQIDKENIIKNSKLEMSIKPFFVTRQDLGKSKSQQKSRKGISRVNSLNKHQLQYHQSQTQLQNSHYSNGPIPIMTNPSGPILTPAVITYSSQQINYHNSKPTITPLSLQPKPPKSNQNSTLVQGQSQQFQYGAKNPNMAMTFPNKNPYSFSPIEEQNKKRQIELLIKIEQLQKQLIIIQRQNGICTSQKNQWIRKCQQLCQVNQNLFKKVADLSEELNFKSKCQQDKQQILRRKQKYIQQLLEQNKSQRQKLNDSYNKINDLNVELQKLTSKIIELQNKQTTTLSHNEAASSLFPHNLYRAGPLINIQQIKKQLQAKKQQIYDLREQNRQLLIKNSSLIQQKNKWQSKLNITLYQLQSEEQKNQVLKQQYLQLKQYMQDLQKQAMLGRALKHQAEQAEKVKLQLKQIKGLNEQYVIKIKQLQQRRLNQIQFHQEQVKRVQLLQATKYENIIEIYKNQKSEALQQMKQLRSNYQSISLNHNETITGLNKQYQKLVIQLKYKLEQELIRYNQLHSKFNSLKVDQQRQVTQLLHALKQLKEDNSYLMNRFNEQKDRNTTMTSNLTNLQQKLVQKQRQIQKDRQKLKQKERQKQRQKQIQKQIIRIRQRQRQSPSQNEKLQQFQNQLRSLQNRNVQMSVKLHQYQLQATKLSDKIHILQIQAQKSRNRQQTYQRKIKHLQEQMEHLQNNKNKSIDEKIKIVEELQNLRMELKTKQTQQKMKQKKIQEYQHKIYTLQKKQKGEKNINQQLQQKNNQLTSEIKTLRQQLDKTKNQLQNLTQQSTISSNLQRAQSKKLQQKILQYEKQIDKFKQCIQLLKQELAINRQKLRITQQISHKLQYSDNYTERNKQNRVVMYKNIFMYLNPQKYSIIIDQNTWKLSQQQIISLLTKAVRLTTEQKNQIQVKFNKLEVQHQDLIQAQNTTRVLAQKYHEKTLQLQNLLIKMQQAHNKKIFLVKQDYDAVYNKYLKYRNMVIAQNKQRERERELSKDKYFKK